MRWAFFGVTILAWTLCGSPAFAVSIPPLVKNLAGWYDASNSGSLTTLSGVSQWNDLSGNGETLVSTSGNQPTYSANCVNGLACIQFSGSGAYLQSNDTNFTRLLLPTSTVFLVENSANDTQAISVFWSSPGYSSALRYNLHIPWAGGVYFDFGNTSSNRVSAGTSTTGTHLWTAVGNENTGNQTFDKDGTTIASGTGASVQTSFSCPLAIGGVAGCGGQTGWFFNGSIEEIVVYNVALSQSNYQKAEGYLACKWGLQGNLPSGHPYKSTCPTGTPTTFSPSISGLAAWYDASNSGSLTTLSLVSQWNDLSGNGETFASTGGHQPAYSTSCVNGLACLSFNGSSAYLTSNDNTFSRLLYPTSTVLMVANSNNDYQCSSAIWSSGSTGRYNWHIPGCDAAVTFDFGPCCVIGQGRVKVSTSTLNTHVWTGIGSVSGGIQQFNKDGTNIASATSASTAPWSCSANIGAMVNPCTSDNGFYFSGSIEEVLVYNSLLSQAEYQYAEGYLACKWGTQANLPSGHPYKSVTCPISGAAALTLSTAVSPTGAQAPGANLTYTTTYTNSGAMLDYNPVVTLPLPAHTAFQLSSASSNQQTTGLAAPTVTYSSDGTTYAYTPTSGGGGAPSGYDAAVKDIRWTFSGALGCGTVNNAGAVTFIAQIQ